MFKRLQFASLCLGFVSCSLFLNNAFAKNYKDEAMSPVSQPTPEITVLKDGFYAGIAAGYDSYKTKQNIDLTLTVTITGNPPVDATGFVGGLFAGYGQYFEKFYLGGEIFANTSNADVSSVVSIAAVPSIYDASFSVGASYGISILPGYKVNDSSLFYLRLGYEWAHLSGNESFTISGLSTYDSRSTWAGGFQYGLGLETVIYPKLSLRGEYTHVDYGSYHYVSGTSVSPADNQGMLGLIYHFA